MIWLLEGLGLLRRSLSRTVLLVLCWTLALLVGGVLGWALEHSLQLREALVGRVPAEIYLKADDARAPARVMEELSRCQTLRLAGMLGREAAAREFQQGFGVDVVELLGENPFPPTVLLKVKADAAPDQLERELIRLRKVPGVEGVHVDRALLGSLGDQLRRMGRLAVGVGLLLALLTLGLLAAAVRSLTRSWHDVARLLALQGARPRHLALPPAVALLLPALLSLALAQGGQLALREAATRLDLPSIQLAPLLVGGGALPLVMALFLVWHRVKQFATEAS